MQVLILYTHEMSDETTLPLLQRAGQHPLDRVHILLRCVTPSGIRMIESEGITAIVVCDTRHEGEHAMLVGKAHALAAQL
ncbi:hypothetical protein HYS28_00745, partial [Candidatus Uhrbacteria bacterium]|nr:hypothetical protein [Candidatus Uhrbacteria bacterium]